MENGLAKIDYESRKENDDVPVIEFDNRDIAKYAQEVSEANNIETSSIAQMGDGEYTIDIKMVI